MKGLDEYVLEFMFSDVSREGVWESSNPKFLEQKAYERSCQVGFRFHILGPVVGRGDQVQKSKVHRR